MSEAHKAARKAYWASQTPEDKSKRMRSIAISKQKKMSFAAKRKHALLMVAARKKPKVVV